MHRPLDAKEAATVVVCGRSRGWEATKEEDGATEGKVAKGFLRLWWKQLVTRLGGNDRGRCDQTVGSGGDYAAGRLHRMPMVVVERGALAASTLAAVVERRSRDCSRCDPLPIAFEGWSVAMALSLLSHQRAGWGARRQLLFEDVMRGSLQGHKEDHTWELESGRLQDEEGVGCRRLRVREMESDAESQQKRRGTRL
ncbi:hypothetical protein BHM03_00017010 [Ensete ventricosum]|nr:hypothetical protein BHM03_00017010 [Ensete ventricosum]